LISLKFLDRTFRNKYLKHPILIKATQLPIKVDIFVTKINQIKAPNNKDNYFQMLL